MKELTSGIIREGAYISWNSHQGFLDEAGLNGLACKNYILKFKTFNLILLVKLIL